jgi:hypothetical protein
MIIPSLGLDRPGVRVIEIADLGTMATSHGSPKVLGG